MTRIDIRLVGVAFAIVALASGPGVVGTSRAATGVLRVSISGALAAPIGASADGQLTLRLGVGLPVFLVSDGGAVIAGSIATATFAQWSDTMPTTDFGSASTLIVFRLTGGFMVVAAGVATPGGFATTFSATAPAQTLSGTWTMAAGPSPSDAVVTFTYDTNPDIRFSGLARFVAGGALTSVVTKPIPGVASVDVLRDVPVLEVAGDAKGGPVGNLASHSAYNVAGHPSELVDLRVIELSDGRPFLLYGCAFPSPTQGIACLVGATDPAAHLSGQISQLAGMFSSIVGVTPADLVLNLTGALP